MGISACHRARNPRLRRRSLESKRDSHDPALGFGVNHQLDDVQAIGYAYGWDEEASFISPRGFKGHIAALRQSLKWAQRPVCYELSFQAPRGLSGAPVWGGKPGHGVIIGMILGNSSTEMVVFSEREVLSEGKEHTFEKVEALHLGFALSASAAVQLHSAHIGMTLGEHFRRCGLLAKARQPTARRAQTKRQG